MIKENIKCNTKTYWIIIGRRVYDCVLSTGCIGELEETLVKKYEAMACLCNDAKIHQDFTNYANKHRAHYNTLLGFLQ